MVVIRAITSPFPSPSRAAAISACRALPLAFGFISTEEYDPSGSSPRTGSVRLALTRHSSAAPGIGRCAPVRPVIEVAAGDEQPVLLQPRIQPPGQRLFPGALARDPADLHVRDRM